MANPSTAIYPGSAATDNNLFVANNSASTTLTVALGTADTTINVASTTLFTVPTLLSIDNEIISVTGKTSTTFTGATRGANQTTAATHANASTVTNNVAGLYHNQVAAEIKSIETGLYTAYANAANYNFTAQTPGGTLAASGTSTLTLSPVPYGINSTDIKHYLYISGGSGTAEAALIVGGTCTSGATSGVLFVTCTNTHSGAWTVQSATAGIQEAIQAGRGGVLVPNGLNTIYAPIFANPGASFNTHIKGLGKQISILVRANGYQGDIIQFNESLGAGSGLTISDLCIENGGVDIFNNTAGSAINIISHGQEMINILGVKVSNGWVGINLGSGGGCGNVVIENYEYTQSSAYATLYSSSAGILVGSSSGAGSDIRVTDAIIRTGSIASTYPLISGIKIQNCDGFHLSNSYIKAQIGVYFLSTAGSITNVFCSNNHIDDVSTNGILVSGTNTISSVIFNGGSINGYATRTPKVSGIDFDSTTSALGEFLINNLIINGFTYYGIKDASPATDCRICITNCDIIGNGESQTGYGVFLGSGVKGLTITGNTMRDSAGSTFTQSYGIGFQGGGTNILIEGNNLLGNDTNGIIVGTGTYSNVTVRNNLGYNPVGVSAITPGTSTYTYTAGVSPETVYIYGGTVSAVAVGSTVIATSGPVQVQLDPLGTVAVTYSSVPTMIKSIH